MLLIPSEEPWRTARFTPGLGWERHGAWSPKRSCRLDTDRIGKSQCFEPLAKGVVVAIGGIGEHHASRHILVDHARAQGRQKRGLRPKKVTLNEMIAIGDLDGPDLLDLDRALQKLEQHDKRKSQVVELLFFGGLTYDECAATLAISPVTLFRELRMAKAWLYGELAPASVRS